MILGVTLIIIGALLLLENVGAIELGNLWAIIGAFLLIVAGFYIFWASIIIRRVKQHPYTKAVGSLFKRGKDYDNDSLK